MKAELIPVDSALWRSCLTRLTHDFYHFPGYVALSAAHEQGTPHAIYASDGNAELLLPVVIRPIPNGGYDATSPYGYSGPVTTDGMTSVFQHEALVRCVNLLKSRAIASLFVRLHPLLNRGPFDVGKVVTSGTVVSIDLRRSHDEIWRETRPGHRADIVRAMRSGHTAAFDESWSQYGAFKNLYRATMQRIAAPAYYHFDDEYFDRLRKSLGDHLRLCVVNVDGMLAAGALIAETSGIVQYHLSASDPAYRQRALTKLIIHFVASWAKDRGNRSFHLGGGIGGAKDSLFQFKAGFAGTPLPFRTLRLIVNAAEYSKLVQQHAGVSAIDPDGYFPAYRAPLG